MRLQLDKAYPRDFMQRGRVRVLIKKDDGSLFNPQIDSSEILLAFFVLDVSFIFHPFVPLDWSSNSFFIIGGRVGHNVI